MPRTLLIAPAGRSVGLTTAALGLLRALDRQLEIARERRRVPAWHRTAT